MVRLVFNTVLVLLVPVLILVVPLLFLQITFATCFGRFQLFPTTRSGPGFGG